MTRNLILSVVTVTCITETGGCNHVWPVSAHQILNRTCIFYRWDKHCYQFVILAEMQTLIFKEYIYILRFTSYAPK